MNKNTLTETEIKKIATKLKKLSPHGLIPFDLFVEFTRLKVTITIEVVPLCLDQSGEVNIVLFNRGPNDLWWPNIYHTPGTCLIADDIPKEDEWGVPSRAYERLKKGEMKDIILIGEPVYIGHLTQSVRRGPESKPVFYQEVDYESARGHLFPLSKLPKNIMDHQINFIHRCAQMFLSQKTTG
ncbi:MAG: hypothetical protein WC503_03500 [Candidatus Shapirobacteria bacterium]